MAEHYDYEPSFERAHHYNIDGKEVCKQCRKDYFPDSRLCDIELQESFHDDVCEICGKGMIR